MAIAAGDEQTFAVLSDGHALAWGSNVSQKLGIDGAENVPLPTPVPALSGVVQIATTDEHSCAVHADGHVSCFGRDFGGSLGRAGGATKPAPAAVAGVSDAVQVAVAGHRSCALGKDGQVRCWGTLVHGVDATPDVVGKLSGAAQLALGGDSSCARLTDGTVACWDVIFGQDWNYGAAIEGKFDGILTSATPIKNVAGATALSFVTGRVCAVMAGGRAECWKSGGYGGFGDAGIGYYFTQPERLPAEPKLKSVAEGVGFSCAITTADEVACWGRNEWGQLGLGDKKRRLQPTLVPGVSAVAQIATGDAHACALGRSGDVRCWGRNRDGQIGDGSRGARETRLAPTPVAFGAR